MPGDDPPDHGERDIKAAQRLQCPVIRTQDELEVLAAPQGEVQRHLVAQQLLRRRVDREGLCNDFDADTGCPRNVAEVLHQAV